MITRLAIRRFKSIRKSSFKPGRVNLFIGGNGAGKSNVLEAIGVVSAALERGTSDDDLGRKGVRITPPELMKSAFKHLDLPRTLEITAALPDETTYRVNLSGSPENTMLAFFSEECTHGAEKIFGRSPRGSRVLGESISGKLSRHRSIWDQVRNAFEFPPAVENALESLYKFAIYTPQTDFLRGVKSGRVHTPPIGLHGEGLPEAVRGLARQLRSLERRKKTSVTRNKYKTEYELTYRATRLAFLPQWASRVKVGKIEEYMASRDMPDRDRDMVYFIDKFMHGRRNTLSVYDSSEGTLFLLFAAVLLSHSESPGVFALDNVDSALNPAMTRALLEAVIEMTNTSCQENLDIGPRQVFLTSHNPSSLDAFDLFDERQRIFVVERNEEGHTGITRLRPNRGMSREDWYEAANGRSLSQLWLDGWIRGALGKSV